MAAPSGATFVVVGPADELGAAAAGIDRAAEVDGDEEGEGEPAATAAVDADVGSVVSAWWNWVWVASGETPLACVLG